MLWVTDINFDNVIKGEQKNTAYFKAKTDYARYLKDINAKILDMFVYYDRNESDASINGRIDGMLAGFHRGDTLIIQIPIYIRPLNIKMIIERIHNQYHGKVIAMIHDYDALLYEDDVLQKDLHGDPLMDRFSTATYDVITPLFDGLIVHSEVFKNTLKKRLNYQKPIIVQGPFGYILPEEVSIPERHLNRSIIFAGALVKAKYLKEIPQGWHLDVFGPMLTEQMKQNKQVNYHGNFSPSELPSHLPDGFGLVWASDSFDEVTGIDGLYTRYNYSHKISAYLAAKIPIIIWSKAAPAKWIVENKLGFAVDNLSEIQPLLNTINEDKYEELQHNLDLMSNLIRDGSFVKQAALKAYVAVNQVNYKSKY